MKNLKIDRKNRYGIIDSNFRLPKIVMKRVKSEKIKF